MQLTKCLNVVFDVSIPEDSSNGLYHKGLQGYIYAINYDMTIFTKKASFNGKYGDFINRDAILVQDNDAALIKAKCE